MQGLNTSDYRGFQWPSAAEDDEEGYPLYVNHLCLLRLCSDISCAAH